MDEQLAKTLLNELAKNDEFTAEYLQYRESLEPKVNYSRAKREDVFPNEAESTSRLLKTLESNKLRPEYWRCIYPDEDGLVDCFVCLVRNPKYGLTFSLVEDHDDLIYLQQLYRHKPKGEYRNYKAKQFLRKFENASSKAGCRGIILEAQPTRLSERLPYTAKGFGCDDVPNKSQLISFYENQGYFANEEAEPFMVKSL